MNLENKILVGVIGLWLGAMILSFGAHFRVWGSRGENTLYSFNFQGKPACVKQRDCRFAPDEYIIEIESSQIKGGHIISDDNKKITLDNNTAFFSTGYKIEEYTSK